MGARGATCCNGCLDTSTLFKTSKDMECCTDLCIGSLPLKGVLHRCKHTIFTIMSLALAQSFRKEDASWLGTMVVCVYICA